MVTMGVDNGDNDDDDGMTLVLRQYDDKYFDNKTSAFDNAREENSITNLSCQKRLQQQQRLPLLLRHQNRLRRE